jgi:hypothetical protein
MWKIDPRANIYTKTSKIICNLRKEHVCNMELVYGTWGRRERKRD